MQEMHEMRVPSLGREDPLEEEMATHSSILALKIPWTEEPGGLYSPWGRKELDTIEQQNMDEILHRFIEYQSTWVAAANLNQAQLSIYYYCYTCVHAAPNTPFIQAAI